MPPARRGCLWAVTGWRFAAAAAGAVLLAAVVDGALKEPPHLGFIPPNTEWMLLCRDTAVFGEKLEHTPAFARYLRGHPEAVGALQHRLRRASHIDLDHRRWPRWFGPTLIAAGNEQGTGFCARPGLALRGLDAVRRLFTSGTVLQYKDYHYVWRDGFLIASRSRDFVQGALADGSPVDFSRGGAPDEAAFISTRAPRLRLTVQAAPGLPISGAAELPIAARESPLTLAGGVLDEAAVTCVAGDWSELDAILRPARRRLLEAAPAELERVIQAVEARWALGGLPQDWDAGLSECGAAWAGVDVVEGLPIPRLAAVFRAPYAVSGPHPWAPLAAPAGPAPYVWGRAEGGVAPLLGPEFGLALAHAGRDWYVFSTEALARAHAGRLPQEAPLEADALLLADWSRLASEAREVAYWMAQEDLLPGRNLEDVEKGLGAALFGLAELGECRIEARRDGRELRLSGWLARETDAEASGL